MTAGNLATQSRRERDACPPISPTEAIAYADRAVEDALDLITDSHDLDPRQVYGRLVLWGRESPARLVTAAYALALMHNPDTPGSVLERNLRAELQERGAA